MIDILLINEAIVPVPSVLNLTDYEVKAFNLLLDTERGFNIRDAHFSSHFFHIT